MFASGEGAGEYVCMHTKGDEIAGIVKGFNLRAWDRCEVILKGTKLRDNYGSRRGRFVMNERGKSHV